MKQKILSLFAFVLISSGAMAVVAPAQTTFAAGTCNESFLSFPAWYEGLTDTNCNIKSPNQVGGLSGFITRIVLNVLGIMLRLVGYISVVFVIYGGFLFLTSGGSSDKISSAKKTIANAVIGLIISFFSVVIVSIVARNIG